MISIWKGTEIYSKHSTNDDNHSNNTKRRSLRTKERKLTNIFEEYIEFSMDVKKSGYEKMHTNVTVSISLNNSFLCIKINEFHTIIMIEAKK